MRDHDSIIVDQWKGLFAVDGGTIGGDNTPEAHFKFFTNMEPTYRGARPRPSLNLNTEFSAVGKSISQMHTYRLADGTERLLYYDALTRKLWDSGFPGAALITTGVVCDFSTISMFGRVYITFHDGYKGLNGDKLYVYKGDGVALRQAGGTAPGGSGTYALGAAGKIEAGDHLFGVVYETDTGFLTPPSALQRLTIPTGGNLQVNVTVIPVGGASISKVHIVATRSIFGYNGNPKDYELFLVPTANGGVVNNGVLVTTLNFFDSDLVSSADYLYDEFATIPAGCGLLDYNGRLLIWGIYGSETYVYASKSGNPESIDQTSGFLAVSPADGAEGIQACGLYRGNLYIHKMSRTYVSADNGGDASTWAIELLDSSIGCPVNGVAKVQSVSGISEDTYILASRAGLIKFDGSFNARPLTWKISALWFFGVVNSLVKCFIDPRFKKIYVFINLPIVTGINSTIEPGVPFNSGTDTVNGLLVGDYSEGLDWENIKWSIYAFAFKFDSCTMHANVGSWIPGEANLILTGTDPTHANRGQVWMLDSAVPDRADRVRSPSDVDSFSVTIPVTMRFSTGFIPDNQEGELNHFAAVGFRYVCPSAGASITLNIYDERDVQLSSAVITATSATRDYVKLINITTEKIRVEVIMTTAVGQFSKLRVFYKPTAASRPL